MQIMANVNSIDSTKRKMDVKIDELMSLLNKYQEIIEESKLIYDTESATLFRRIANSYVEIMKQYLNNECKPYINKLDEVKNKYIEQINAISGSIYGGVK